MAPVDFPKAIAIKSIQTEKFLRCRQEPMELRDQVISVEEDIYSIFVKVEVEVSKEDSKYVHLRYSHNNKYWRKNPNGDDPWVMADENSKEKVEDKTSPLCTLFEASVSKDGQLYLKHVRSGGRVRTSLPAFGYSLYIDTDAKADDKSSVFGFSFVDLETIVKLPQNIAFKGDNEKFLVVHEQEGHPYLTFTSDDANDENAAQVVTLTPDGHVKIATIFTGKYWRLSPNWIWADSVDGSEDALFWPVKVDETTVALQSKANMKFCKRLTDEGKTDCLNADASTLVKEARFKVVELVLEREIYNIRYRMKDARIYDEKAVVVGTGSAENNSDEKSSLSVKVSFKKDKSSSFKHTIGFKIGAKTTFVAKVPFIFEGKIEVSAEVSYSHEWAEVTTESETAEATYQATVPPKSRVKVEYVATKGTCDVPFNYTQRDKSSNTGKFITTTNIDGVYTGSNLYNFHFTQPKIEPL